MGFVCVFSLLDFNIVANLGADKVKIKRWAFSAVNAEKMQYILAVNRQYTTKANYKFRSRSLDISDETAC